jgi:hypothetical protein
MRTRRSRRRLRATNDHHQEFIRADEGDRRPRAHDGTDEAVTQAVGDVRGQGRMMPTLSSHLASAGTRPPRRAESSITIERA